MTRPGKPDLNDQDWPHEFSTISDQLQTDADRLANQYSPTEANPELLSRLRATPPIRSAARRRPRVALAVALTVLLAVSWAHFAVPDPEVDVPQGPLVVMDSAKDSILDAPSHSNFDAVETLPVITESVPGLEDMNGPELEAVLNLLDGETSDLKLAI